MVVAITGGTGFVGQAVLEEAAARGLPLRALTRREQPPAPGIEWVRGDLAAVAALHRLVEGAQAVLHIAGVVSSADAGGFIEGNVRGTERIVAAARSASVPRFVLVSSLAAREPDLSAYGSSKREGELVVEASGLDWTIVRPPAVYGPRDTEMFQLFRAARWGIVPMPPAGRTSIIHVADLARLLLALLPGAPAISGHMFEPDDGRAGGWSHRELARAIGAAIGRKVLSPRVPAPLFTAAARLDRWVRGEGAKLTPDRARYMLHPDWTCSPARSVPESVWHPRIGTAEGLRATAEWYRAQGWL
jgi:uncharacterized protein YbjT (DUF2867 family)